MNPPRKILVTPSPSHDRMGTGHKGNPIPFLWGAELVGTGIEVRGYDHAHQAVGALIRQAVQPMEADEAFEFIATLFGDSTNRDPDALIGRAIHYANKAESRKHPGCVVKIQKPGVARVLIEQPVCSPRRKAVKGGAA